MKKKKAYVVVWEREETYVLMSEERAITKVEQITGRTRNVWTYEDGDYDDDGRSVWYSEAILEDE